ncbi:class I SAM-dependent methyltransferase [Actinokineospora sp. HBU206404]|uniref:Class I SAM-dependent methyltransferase n=1 Tax=Actinokineospora xionganensis TaxID=2684470 RepID=A0ABR7LBX2_9PSEU|nr:class I SAM-dependent methyltransferase [Actinokineospora xionganensis]
MQAHARKLRDGHLSFEEVRRDWTELGARDSLWAVHVANDKRGGRWEVDDFLELGRRDVARARDWLHQLGLPTKWSRVLDFGCGAGRLSQALAEYADEVVGVDVSVPMLETARALDRSDGKCQFVLNEVPDLHVFTSNSFDLVYSELVLQHLPAKVIADYLGEFVRVLRPGAVAVLQCTSRPLWTLKGTIWRLAPYRMVRLGQKLVLRYPAPMRMTALPPAKVAAVVSMHGAEIVAAITTDEPETHWQSSRYVIRKLGRHD